MVDLLPTYIADSSFTIDNTDAANPQHFALPIPAGTDYGDLLVASIMTWSGTIVAPGRGLAELYKADPYGQWAYGVWAGPWDGDTTPIAWQGSGIATATGQFAAAILVTYRNALDPNRPLQVSYGPTVPGLRSQGPALCVNWLRADLGGVSGFHPFTGTDWTFHTAVDGAYVLGTVAAHGGIVGDQTSTDASAASGWPYMSFGLVGQSVAPPCRVHPREDQLGVGSGRIWPPPRSHQASPRRAGGYY